MAISKSTTLANTLPTIIEEARFWGEHKAVMAGLSWKIKKELHKGSTVKLPYFGYVSAGALTEGVDMASPTTMADYNTTITPAEVGCQILITDKLERDNQEDIVRAAGRILGDAMERKRDTDLWGQLDDGVVTLGGNTTMTMGILAAARAQLAGVPIANAGPAPTPYVAVQHPYVWLDLVDILTPVLYTTTNVSGVGTAGLADNILREYTIGRLFGMPCVEDGNGTILSGPQCNGAVFAAGTGGGLVLVTADEWDIRPERDESLRATELNIVGEYGVGEYIADWIITLNNDCTAPV